MSGDIQMPGDLEILDRLLAAIESDVLPKTRAGVAQGNQVFGAALLDKRDGSIVPAETNNEVENPLWHGEVHALKRFYERPRGERPPTSRLIFDARALHDVPVGDHLGGVGQHLLSLQP